MGLAEKRALAKLRDEVLPKYQTEIQQITGVPIAYDVDWDSFTDNPSAMGYLEDKCLKPLSDIFQEITRDKIGKEAVAESIKQIHLSQGGASNISDFTLRNGVLDLGWDWASWPGSFYPDTVRERIESLL